MPFYEYKCGDCGETFEYFARSMSDAAECCSRCGSREIKKLFSSFGFKSGSASSGDFRSSASSSSCSSCTATSCSSCKP
ncbi:FmdB family zinc ribbon protein [Candidatus Solincola sp.]|nr:zinc ribbon domain-containing protein [Actinomycetota bacterium]MDI7252164.1 zinc ribbon domain-containing protein [Actinomycetota bacterium]